MRIIAALLTALCASAFGCSSSSDDPDQQQKKEQSLDYTFEATVEAGDEIQKCIFVTVPEDKGELAVGRMWHEYSPGSHHFLVYRTDLTEVPAGGDVLQDCDEANWMSNVRGVVYAAQETEGEFVVPKGVGQKFTPGEVILVQTHYLNTSPKALDARIDFHMGLIEPESVEQEAGVLFFYNPAIHVPPASKKSATLTCPIPNDITLAFASSHMHKRGVNFVAETSDPNAAAALGPLFQTTEWSEPVPRVFPLEPPASIKGGTEITYTCEFDNPDAATIVQGGSADTNEMCMFVSMYWPRADSDVDFCRDGSVSTTGTKSALETLSCLVGCYGSGDDACNGACWDTACPKAPTALVDFFFCMDKGGPTACYLDPTGDACKTFMQAECPAAYTRLTGVSCGP